MMTITRTNPRIFFVCIDWNGDPLTYKESLHDYQPCELYSNHSIFQVATGNNVFCITEYEHQVSSQFIDNFFINHSWGMTPMKEILLQQLYGIYRANMAAKQFALMREMTYKYKIRLRPDIGLVKPMLLPDQINFNGDVSCKNAIYYPNAAIMAWGAEDTFNIGEAEDMDHLLDRYVDLTTKPFIYRPWRNRTPWTSESYLAGMLDERYHLCLRSMSDLWMVVLRKPDHVRADRTPITDNNIWVQLNAKI
jgi:hypothetical protein